MSDNANNLQMSLADLIKKDKPAKAEGLAGNRGGKGNNRGRGGKIQQGRPRYNEAGKVARNDLFRARKGANAIAKNRDGARRGQ